MSAVTQAPQAQAAIQAPAWTTPQILKTGMVAIWIASALLMTAAIAGARGHRHAMQVVGRDSAPSIIAAQQIRAALADMDANAAAESRKLFEQRRDEAVSAIVAAAENITYGDAERTPIHTLALGVGTYAAEVQAARDRHDIAAWRDSVKFMDTTLLPAAAALDHANRAALDEAYASQEKSSAAAMAMLVLSGLATGVVVIGIQIFLTGRMRRLVNPLLFLTTLATLVFVISAGQSFRAADHELKVAKEDAFESIHVLWQARAAAFSANGELGRAALDAGQRSAYEAAFVKNAELVEGFLDAEIKNITFVGEDEPAKETVSRFAQYRKTRSSADFTLFDDALGRTLAVNRKAFSAAVDKGFGDVAQFELTAPIWAVGISLLSWLGLRPRIREYST